MMYHLLMLLLMRLGDKCGPYSAAGYKDCQVYYNGIPQCREVNGPAPAGPCGADCADCRLMPYIGVYNCYDKAQLSSSHHEIVNGAWSVWSNYDQCSKSCGSGMQSRVRTCTAPSPSNGGRQCVGDSKQTKKCIGIHCPVNGAWSNWTNYNQCSKSCGSGMQSRVRTCSAPAPSSGGRQCVGDSKETKKCIGIYCPVHGAWSVWSNYNECSKSCGSGMQSRVRTCTAPSPSNGGRQCVGDSKQSKKCIGIHCPVTGGWTNWGPFQQCDKSCGGGLHLRFRNCTNPTPSNGGSYCIGNSIDYEICNKQSCAVNGGWTVWGSYGPCDKSCNGGKRVRYRNCTNPSPSNGGLYCIGDSLQISTCNNVRCREFVTVPLPVG